MPFTRSCLPLVIAGTAAAVVLDAAAAGLSASATSAVLGQPLDFAVQVRLQPGETLSPECISAEVTLGDRRLPAPLVRTVLAFTGADTARIRVITDQAIDEPVVGVLLNAGCPSSRFSRRFVVFADPPIDIFPSAAAVAALPLVPALALATVASSGGTSPAAGSAPADSTTAADAAAGVQGLPAPAGARGDAPRAARAPQEQAARVARQANLTLETRDARDAREAREARRIAQRSARDERRAAAARVDKPPAAAVPRLRLEAAEPAPAAVAVGVEAALQAVAEAASAARAAAAVASAAVTRVAALERTVVELRGEANASREGAAELRTRLARAEESSRWTTPLLALVLLMTAVAAWLAWRLNKAERVRQRSWQTSAPAGVAALNPQNSPSKLLTSPIPFVTSEIKLPSSPAARSRPAWPAPVSLPPDSEAPVLVATQPLPRHPPENSMLRTEPMPSLGLIEESAPRDVSIEELIDLEQQAEFFVVLGQDDAAVDLLVEHLRHTGGGSPLPYLKLLEIYRRRGRRVEYERLRERFNLRFNAYAPEWEADLQAGRTLDSYAGVIPRLQRVWPRPLDAMAELEALLFRKSRGDLFDLPAYREVLFLYSLARDLLDREAGDSGQIDLLLPLADGGEFSSTAPAPYLTVEGDSMPGGLHGTPTAPLDFDLGSDPTRPTSIFGPLDDMRERPSRR